VYAGAAPINEIPRAGAANYFNCASMRRAARIFMLLMGEVGYLVAVMHNLCGVHHMQCGVRSNCLRADLCEILPSGSADNCQVLGALRCRPPPASLLCTHTATHAAFAYILNP